MCACTPSKMALCCDNCPPEVKVPFEPMCEITKERKLGFNTALLFLKSGYKLAREGWNGKGMYVCLQEPDGNSKMSLPYIYMKTACGNLVPWLASQTDLLANDWRMVQ